MKTFGDFVAVDHVSLDSRAGRDLRLPGTQRRRQIHHHPHPVRPAGAHFGTRVGGRASTWRAQPEEITRATSATCRRSSRSTTTSRWKRTSSSSAASTAFRAKRRAERKDYVLKMAGLEERRRRADAPARGRLEAAAGAGLRDPARAADSVSGRADLRRRPHRAAHFWDLIYQLSASRPHHLRHHALHGRSRILPSHRADVPRQGDRAGLAGGVEGRADGAQPAEAGIVRSAGDA